MFSPIYPIQAKAIGIYIFLMMSNISYCYQWRVLNFRVYILYS